MRLRIHVDDRAPLGALPEGMSPEDRRRSCPRTHGAALSATDGFVMRTKGKTPPVRIDLPPWLDGGAVGVKKVVQFNWRRHWKKKVAPHLHEELVEGSLDLGMRLLDPHWRRGDPPYLLGREPGRRAIPGKL